MIRIENLHYQYDDGTPALKGIDLEIQRGEFLLICGPNGSGKTTLIRHLNGLHLPSSGRVVVDGVDTAQDARHALRRVGMVFQDADSQIIGETVWEDVAFGPENLGLDANEIRERVNNALALVGLEALGQKSCHLLSGGEKRRVAIAGVLAMQPDILVFDEPFANLDYPGVTQVLQQIVKLHGMGHTLILTTHDVEKVVAHVDTIAIMHRGEIKTVGPPAEILPQLARYGIRPPCFSLFGGRPISWLTE